MAIPRELLIAASLMSSPEKAKLDELSRVDPLLVDAKRLRTAIDQAADDRLTFAKEFLGFGGALLPRCGSPQDMFARNALARTYYAAHHAIRAALLYRNDGDVYDHRDAINAFEGLLDDNSFLAEKVKDLHGTGTTPAKVRSELVNLLDMRHDADYHGYGSKEPSRKALDFQSEAKAAQAWVTELILKIETYIKERRAGIYK